MVTGMYKKPRYCGECKACCRVFDLADAYTERWKRCPKLNPAGCSVHTEKPDACRAYSCLWLDGKMPEKLRPDKSGVVVTQSGPDGLILHEVWMGASREKLGRAAVNAAKKIGKAKLVTYGSADSAAKDC